MPFKTEDKKVSDLLNKRVYLIPRNQRQYVWKEENWKDLIEDLEFSFISSKRAHFMGSLVLKKEKGRDKGAGVEVFSIIDGQQRITTFLLFLSVIMFRFKKDNETERFEGLKSYLITNNLDNNAFCKLSTEKYPALEIFVQNICDWKNNYDSLDQAISESSTATKTNKVLFEAVKFFNERLTSCDEETIERYRNALLDTNIVEIIADSDEDAYTIFEILNARGQILEDYDLLKNFIMRYYEPSNEIDKAKSRWEQEIILPLDNNVSQFVQHYVLHRYGKNKREKVSNYEVLKSKTSKHDVIKLLDDLCRKASYYKIIVDPKDGDDSECSKSEYTVFSFMKSYRGVMFRPIFLSLMHRNKTSEISNEIYESVLNFIMYFFICYNLLGRLTSNKLTDRVQSSAIAIENDYSPEVLKSFINGLVNRLPTLDEFTKSFLSIGWSKINEFHNDTNQKRRVIIALQTLESIETGCWDIGSFTIEHLNPDSLDRTNANIGNLVLLESNINSNNLCKVFTDKIDSYKDSRYKTTRNVYSRFHDNPDTFNIETRAKQMAKKIISYIEEQKNDLLKLLTN